MCLTGYWLMVDYKTAWYESNNNNNNNNNDDDQTEFFSFTVYCWFVDVRELVELDDVMEAADLQLGPNGGLVFCME